MQPNSAVHPGGEITLAHINEMLNEAGFPIINPQRVQTLQELAPRARIIKAIQTAKTDQGARAYLTNLFNQAGIIMSRDDHSPEHQQPRGHQSAEPRDPTPRQNSAPHGNGSREGGNQQQHRDQPAAPSDDRRNDRYNAGSNQSNRQTGREGGEGPRMSPEDRENYHVYGGKAALCFEADITKGGIPTIALDAAPSVGSKQYNWNDKIRLQMTRAELPVVLAVLTGALNECEFKNHGPDSSKGFSMQRQEGGKVFVRVFSKDGARAVPVIDTDVFYVASLFIRQLRKAQPWLDTNGVLNLVRAVRPGQGNGIRGTNRQSDGQGNQNGGYRQG